MKALKIIGVVLAVLVAAGVVIGLVTPKDYDLHRSVVIAASNQVVFNNISHYSEFPQWSPWQHLDPKMKTKLEGEDGTVGAKYSWVGNDDAGEGSMTITKLEPGAYVEQALEFLKPFKSSATTYFNVEEVDGAQKVTWGMKGENGFVARIFMTLMGGIDKAVGKDYENGLANLKTLCESAPAAVYQVKEADWTAKVCLSKRKVVGFQDFASFYGDNFPKMFEAITKAGAKPGVPLGVYYMYDEKEMKADVAAAIPYEGANVASKDFAPLNLPAAKGYSIDYLGDYNKMGPAYEAMNAKLKELGKTNPEMVIEEYLTDPGTEKDTAKWLTRIYFFVK